MKTRVFLFLLVLRVVPAPGPGAARAEPLANLTFVVFDTETTGFSAGEDRIVELAAVRIRSGRALAAARWLVNPGMPIPAEATRVHGITDEAVALAPPFRDVYPEFRRFLGDAVLLAHNAAFDIRFVRGEVARDGLAAPENLVLDILTLARARYPGAASYSLQALAAMLAIPGNRAHRALDDAERTAAFFAVAIGPPKPVADLEALIRLCGGPRYFVVTPPRKAPSSNGQ